MARRGVPSKPADVFGREAEWRALAEFATAPGAGVRIGIVRGRRRQGKSYLLRRLVRATGGFYYQALEEEPAQALARLGSDLGRHLDLPSGRVALGDWSEAVRALIGLRTSGGGPTVVVLDEFPYLLAHSPELASVLQLAYDDARDDRESHARLFLCGSALSVMSNLLSAQGPLRGRAALDLVIDTFDYREAARFWGITQPQIAFRVHAVVGGTPGYRDLLSTPVPRTLRGFDQWLLAGPLDPSSALFREADYLLDSARALTDRALYHSVLAVVAAGNTTQASIAAQLGREQRAIQHPLRVLEETGFLIRADDMLRQRRPTYRIADPIVRFHQAIIRPDTARFEERRGPEAWADAADRFSSQVLGPHFEELARDYVRRYATSDALGGVPTRVGTTVVNDAAGRSQHQLDVVALQEQPSQRRSRVLLLGEAKHSTTARSMRDVVRLEQIRDLLARREDLDLSQTRPPRCLAPAASTARSDRPLRTGPTSSSSTSTTSTPPNRPPGSGARSLFRDRLLLGAAFPLWRNPPSRVGRLGGGASHGYARDESGIVGVVGRGGRPLVGNLAGARV